MTKYTSRSRRIGRTASITNRPSGGGNKKGGLGPSVGKFSLWNGLGRTSSTPNQRAKVFCINQIGGVGRDGNYQTQTPSDGVTPRVRPLNTQNGLGPCACNRAFLPVCAFVPNDGVLTTYNNICLARCAGAQIFDAAAGCGGLEGAIVAED